MANNIVAGLIRFLRRLFTALDYPLLLYIFRFLGTDSARISLSKPSSIQTATTVIGILVATIAFCSLCMLCLFRLGLEAIAMPIAAIQLITYASAYIQELRFQSID